MIIRNLKSVRQSLSVVLALTLMGSSLVQANAQETARGMDEVSGGFQGLSLPTGISNNLSPLGDGVSNLPGNLDNSLNIFQSIRGLNSNSDNSEGKNQPQKPKTIRIKAEDNNQGNSAGNKSDNPDQEISGENGDQSSHQDKAKDKKEDGLQGAENRIEKNLDKAKDAFYGKKDKDGFRPIQFERRAGHDEPSEENPDGVSLKGFNILRALEHYFDLSAPDNFSNITYLEYLNRVNKVLELKREAGYEGLKGLGIEKAADDDLQKGWDQNNGRLAIEGRAAAKVSHTPTLDEFGADLTQQAAAGKMDPVYGREHEIAELINILNQKRKRNAVLIGEAGVGKTAIVEGLAQKIAAGQVPGLEGKRIVSLDVGALIAGTKYRGEFEERVNKLIRELEGNPDVIVFIDELHQIVGANSSSGGERGSMNMANMLKTALARGTVQMIGATTLDEYRRYIEKDAALERRLQTVTVKAPGAQETVAILQTLKPGFEKHHQVIYEDAAIKAAAELAEHYVYGRNLPDSAIDVLDGAGAAVRALGRNTVTEGDVRAVVSRISGVPVEKMDQAKKDRLTHIESFLKQRIKGQDEALKVVSEAVRADRAGFKTTRAPLSFLFTGPTGVGKTETAKALTEFLFGSERNLIRLDMSEYHDSFQQSRAIGAAPGYIGSDKPGDLTEKVRRNPYSVILLDEIDKASPDFLNLLLQVLDEGHLTDNAGKIVDFSHTIIIMSANYMSQAYVERPHHLGFNADNTDATLVEKKMTVNEGIKHLLRPEFYNRIGDVVAFNPLTQAAAGEILDQMLSRLQRVAQEKGIELEMSLEARDFLLSKGYDESYGARPMRRAIDRYLTRPLAMESLKSSETQRLRVVVSPNGEGLEFETL